MLFGKLLQVDLSNKGISEISVDRDVIKKFLGAKGLGAYLLYTMLQPHTDPLSPANLLMFLNGPLTGTPFPTSGRTTVVTKSPLTGLFLDCHVGGFFGPELKRAGFDGIILKGRSEKPVYLWINDGNVEFRDAEEMWGLTVSETVDEVRGETENKAHIASIGPAGENLVKIASIAIDKDSDPWRAGIAARGGPGAVMGSKNLKAIAVMGLGKVDVYDGDKFKEISVEMTKRIVNNTFVHTRRVLGTSYWIDPMNRMGILPTRNFQAGYIENGYGISGSNLRYYVKRDVSCYNCPIVCGKVVEIDEKAVKVEYEDIALLGSNNGIKDIVDVSKALIICNELGLDAISTGGTVAFGMECKEKGILADAPKFGDAEGQRKLIKDIAYRNGIGDLLADGTRKAAGKIEQGSEKFAIHVKGMELPGYEPRSSWGMAIAYATSDRGGCHQRAWTVRPEIDGILKRFSIQGVAQFVKDVQDERAAAFSIVLCDFAPLGPEDCLAGLKCSTGIDLTGEEYIKIGERIWNLTRLFNMREADVSRKDDTLPPRMFEEALPMPPNGEKKVSLLRDAFDTMLTEYYFIRGWSENGIPTQEKLDELGLNKI
jgi:aldehyde:ferredoxin oxidoreductase